MDKNREPPEEDKVTMYDILSKRSNLQSFVNYALEGVEKTTISTLTLDQRQDKADRTLENDLLKFIDEDTLDKIAPIINAYTADIRAIGAEIGIIITARLTRQVDVYTFMS